jgi:hypothetical protein
VTWQPWPRQSILRNDLQTRIRLDNLNLSIDTYVGEDEECFHPWWLQSDNRSHKQNPSVLSSNKCYIFQIVCFFCNQLRELYCSMLIMTPLTYVSIYKKKVQTWFTLWVMISQNLHINKLRQNHISSYNHFIV